MVSDVLRPILAHVRSKYSNTQHPDLLLRTTSRQTQAKGSAPLTTTNLETPQNHVSCSMWSTCPRSFSPQTRFFGPGGCKMFAHFDYSNKKGKIRQKIQPTRGIKKPVASSPTAEDSSASRCSLRHNGPLQVRRSGGCRHSG